MRISKWIEKNTASLSGKTVAITGSTGGLGQELVRYFATLGAKLLLMDRNTEKSEALRKKLFEEFPNTVIELIKTDLSDIESTKRAAIQLKEKSPDIFIHNAGAYSIPRYVTDIGYDNVFEINFISVYYLIKEILPTIKEKGGKIVAVSSIAHNYSKRDPDDVDFRKRKRASKVYGNAKRYLTYSLFELFREEREAELAIAHPGISFTNITAHYPKLIFALIKHPMKIIFMKPKKAALSIVKGVFESTDYCEWIGPRFLSVWGLPKKQKLKTATREEITEIFNTAEKIYNEIK